MPDIARERNCCGPEWFQPSTIKRHRPATVRHDTGEGYRGCLMVSVLRGRELYRLIEGIVLATIGGSSGNGVAS